MSKRTLPTPDMLRQLIDYNPDTGLLTWKPRTVEMFENNDKRICATWNTRYAGKEAIGHIDANGYKCGHIFKSSMKAHRAAWAIYYGAYPKHQIDHIDGDRTNNAINNLRDVTQFQNQRNAGVRSDNRSGHPGVFQRNNGYFSVYCRGKYLGSRPTLKLAMELRLEAERSYEFHENHGKRKGRPKPPSPDG